MMQLKIQNVTHNFGETQVLKDINLELQQGEMLAVLGASGCGKTTLLRSIAGFVNPTQGTLIIGSQTVLENGASKVVVEDRNIGMVFQDHALFPHMTVEENILFGIHEQADRHERCNALLKLIEMTSFAQRHPHTLSGGQQQRIALARALAPRPALLLLDEPFANLDANLRHEMALEVRNILKASNTTAVMVTHDKTDALTMADRLAILEAPTNEHASSLIQINSPAHIYAQPSNQTAAQLTGTCTCIEALAKSHKANSALGEIPLQNNLDGKCWVVFRPENLVFEENDNAPNKITQKSFMGNLIQWTVATPCGDVLLHTPPDVRFNIGQSGDLSFRQPCWAFKS